MELYPYEKEHLAALRNNLGGCMVLLKKNGAFPLPYPSSIAAYGSGVRNSVKGGTGSGEVNSRFSVSIEQGLIEAGFSVTTGNWLDAYDREREKAKKEFRKTLRQEARESGMNMIMYAMGAVMPEPEFDLPVVCCADAAIYVVSRISGEGNDRRAVPGDVLLTKSEIRDILALDRMYEHFMLVINAGGPVDLSPVMSVGNILVLSQLGTEMGSALADVLLGKTYPSGKLTTTWAAWEDYCPDIEIGDKEDTHYTEGVYVGYRYFDTVGKKALFPFGFGISYTDFRLGESSLSVHGTQVTVHAEVTNTGNYPGREVVQLYVTAPEGKLKKPYQDLAAFSKTGEIPAGENAAVTLSFDLRELASFDDERHVYFLEPGEYILRLGTSSADTTPIGILTLGEEVILKKVRAIIPKTDLKERNYERAVSEQLPQDLPRFEIDASCIAQEETVYDKEQSVEDAVRTLSDSELAYLFIGAFSEKGGISSVIGDAASHVAGAAGETTSKLSAKGFKPIIMADGPAGLRLSRDYYMEGQHACTVGGATLPASILDSMGPVTKTITKLLMGGNKAVKGKEIRHQYCTAIPIGTAIAQSWDLEFATRCGDLVGEEMERFGVHLWLAPALNIHRSILCGRNFEYFSEDPLISGRMAAAITNGVQAHPSCGTTIKHLAANNQELNRYFNSSVISERTLREIYLKGFALCIRESQPHALMTSYNLINGVHSSELRGLTEDFLRSENGFEGIVMTDWVMNMPNMGSQYPKAQSQNVAAAGGDLFMPGNAGDFKAVIRALKDGTLPRRQLEISGSRVLRMIRRLCK